MSIVLSILQILGIILLCLLGVFLVVVLFVLFAPISYTIEGDIHETKWAKARVSWLLHLIRAKVSYEDDLLYGEVGIFWKKITFSHDFTEAAAEEEHKDESASEQPETETQAENDAPKESFIDKIKKTIDKIKDIYPRVKKILNDDRNKQAVKHLKEEVFYLIKTILPKKSRMDATFSTGSPDTTGQLCGVIACFPFMYQKDWALRPDFTAETPLFLGSFWGKGRFFVFQLVGILLRILFDKNCRRLYTMINRLLKRIKGKTSQEGK